jgi:hypothetical protein
MLDRWSDFGRVFLATSIGDGQSTTIISIMGSVGDSLQLDVLLRAALPILQAGMEPTFGCVELSNSFAVSLLKEILGSGCS